MSVTVHFYSYVKDITGASQVTEELPPGAILDECFEKIVTRYPKLAAMQKSLLLAVGVEYQPRSYVLKDGDAISIFPPVQGG